MTLVEKVSAGSLYEVDTMAWAARWKTKSGLTVWTRLRICPRSRTSACTCWMRFAMPRDSNIEGVVGTSLETPMTSAPSLSSQVVSQLPLKPVWPVTNTRWPL
jgi:hypothetical protein